MSPTTVSRQNQSCSIPILRAFDAYIIIVSLFLTALLLTNLVAVKYVQLGVPFTAGVFPYSFTFLLSDIVTECYGKRYAQRMVHLGILVSLFMLGLLAIVRSLPTHIESPVSNIVFDKVFGFTPGMVLGSLTAYSVAQWTDIQVFEALRRFTQERKLWLRNSVSTLLSQWIDTFIFAVVAWYVWPWLDWTGNSFPVPWLVWWQITLVEYGIKVVMTCCSTPFVYAGRALLYRWSGKEALLRIRAQ